MSESTEPAGATSTASAPTDGRRTPGAGRGRWRRDPGRSWRAIFFAPIGDGQRRRRGSDGVRLGLAALAVLFCLLALRLNPNAEHTVLDVITPAPNGIRWLVASLWWVGTVGVMVAVAVLAALSRRWAVLRDPVVAGVGAWLVTVGSGALFGTTGGRPPDLAYRQFSYAFPVAQVAMTVAVATAASPYLSRWLQRTLRTALGLLLVVAVANGSGLPLAVLASLAVGIGATALVHLVLGSPLGLPSADEVAELLGDLGLAAAGVVPRPRQDWGVGRFSARIGGAPADVSFYGRDAADAQLLAKAARFVLYRDSGPTLTFTRRQQVEHEAYLTLLAERAGASVPRVLAAGPAGPARDALLVCRPPPGRPLADLPPWVDPDAVPDPDAPPDPDAAPDPVPDPDAAPDAAPGADAGAAGALATVGGDGGLADAHLDAVLDQLLRLRDAGIAHGGLSTETIVVDADGRAGFLDLRTAADVARPDALDRDTAAVLAAVSVVCGPERTLAAAHRVLPAEVLVAALPFLQRAALGPAAARTLRGRKGVLTALREGGARVAGVEVPDLVEPRRISWVTLALVVGTLIGGWALIGVLVNVTKSWDTITGAAWGWVIVTFLLAQAAYPAIAVTTVGSVTDSLPYGRAVLLEFSDVFVGLAGGSMAVLATRVRFFQQEGYEATLAVSSGVLVATASWIVKGGLFLIALPIAISQFHFAAAPTETGGGAGSSTARLVWLLILVIISVGVALGLVFAVPRWRRLAAAKLRPKASEVWGHLKVLSAHPRNLVEIFGGSIAAQLFVALALGASLHAFGERLSLAALIIVLTLGSMLGGVSPVPGGMGVVEAGMILGLTAAGIPENDAVAAVFVQRLFTAYLPPIWGWVCLMWMRRREYL